jgi:hypothetical protein
MSDPKTQPETELQDLQQEPQEISADDAENVRGGVLIGLNQPALKLQPSTINQQTGFADGSVFNAQKIVTP